MGTWNINRQTSNFYAGRCFPRTVATEVSDVVVTCKDDSSSSSTTSSSSSSSTAWSYPLSSAAAVTTKTSSNDLNLEQRVCSLGVPVSVDDCRLDRCQGCRRDYSPSGCDVTVESCQCGDDNSGGGNTFSPTASPSTSCQQLNDDPSFFFRKKKKTCRWIGKRAHRIKKFCVKKIKFGQEDTGSTVARKPVSTFCPVACGVCN